MKVIRRTALIAAAAAVTLTLAACSSSTGSATSAPSTAAGEVATKPAAGGTIVDIASTSEGFGTLVAAVQAAGLVDTLNGAGPFTVFAPTDAAFAALPAGLLDALLKPENKDLLTKILTYHVVPGKVLAADVTDGDVATVEGQSITISTMDGVKVNGAKVVTVDVLADNGVIHAIDAVILPPDVDAAALLAK
ncbi:MAG: hypothetical protein CK552_05470 [Actinobacteria bacterium]|nr:MAG: hypothetical protein CK552_05470 [Actinomycetota bacterium]